MQCVAAQRFSFYKQIQKKLVSRIDGCTYKCQSKRLTLIRLSQCPIFTLLYIQTMSLHLESPYGGIIDIICICNCCFFTHRTPTCVCSFQLHVYDVQFKSNERRKSSSSFPLQQRSVWKVSIFRNNCQGQGREGLASSACNLPAILHGEEWGDVACFQGGNLDL